LFPSQLAFPFLQFDDRIVPRHTSLMSRGAIRPYREVNGCNLERGQGSGLRRKTLGSLRGEVGRGVVLVATPSQNRFRKLTLVRDLSKSTEKKASFEKVFPPCQLAAELLRARATLGPPVASPCSR